MRELPVYLVPRVTSDGYAEWGSVPGITVEKSDNDFQVSVLAGERCRELTVTCAPVVPPVRNLPEELPLVPWEANADGVVVKPPLPSVYRLQSLWCSLDAYQWEEIVLPLPGTIRPGDAPELSIANDVQFFVGTIRPSTYAVVGYRNEDTFIPYGVALFELAHIAGGIITGCGLHDGTDWIAGGSGAPYHSDWGGEPMLCWEVLYGETAYPVRSSDCSVYALGEYVLVLRNWGATLPPEKIVSWSDARKRRAEGLSLQHDMIFPATWGV